MKITSIVVFIIAAVCVFGTSHGFNQSQLDSLLATKRCEYCDLRNADLTGAALTGARLIGANLTGARLSKANLSDANLYGTVLTQADLRDANLTGAFMRGTRLNGANLTGANLSKANMEKATLLDANLTSIVLSETNFSSAVWKDGTRCEENSYDECKKQSSSTSPRQSTPMPGSSSGGGPGIPF